MKKNTGNFSWKIIFSFFCSSFSPLFFTVCIRQLISNCEYLNFGGFSKESFFCFLNNFSLGVLLFGLGIFGLLITVKTIKVNTKNAKTSGKIYKILSFENKNKDSVAYIATYMLSFFFQNFNQISEAIIFIFILFLIFILYAKTNLFMYNPVLLPWFSIYDIECERTENGNKEHFKAEIIIRDDINIDSEVKLYPIGNDIYLGNKE